MKSIQLFQEAEIRFVEHPEQKYAFGIVAEDLAKVLEASRGADIARSVNNKWIGSHNVQGNAGTRSVTIIWEPGIYQILAKSRKPKAQVFQDWLFEQVLPKIRETGEYVEEVHQPIKRVLPSHSAVEYGQTYLGLSTLPDGIAKKLLMDALVDELSLQQNLKYLPVAEKPKQYTIVKVRAKMLGYTDQQIGNGQALGKFVRAQVEPAFQEVVGRFPVFHYEINQALDDAITAFFS